ncbi:putative anion transporter 4, chloroplastic-like [Capsicum annuum]|nr:putative anion transporter 4, chloroplastic-like [Capsicum annuum]
MEEEITERLLSFILTEDEKDTVELDFPDIKTSLQDCEVSVLGKIIVDKEISLQGVRNTIPRVWGYPIKLRILKIEKNLFQFVFMNKESMNKVLFDTPWLFDKYLLNVKAWEPRFKSDSAFFNICELWLQVWSIPLHWML